MSHLSRYCVNARWLLEDESRADCQGLIGRRSNTLGTGHTLSSRMAKLGNRINILLRIITNVCHEKEYHVILLGQSQSRTG